MAKKKQVTTSSAPAASSIDARFQPSGMGGTSRGENVAAPSGVSSTEAMRFAGTAGTPAQPAATPQKVTLTEAKALGFNSTQGITKVGDMYYFDKSLAPDREGFAPVGVAKPGQVQMTPYYGDVTGAYKLTQEQFAQAYASAGGDTDKISQNILKVMEQNEKAAKDKKYQELLVTLKAENPTWTEDNLKRAAEQGAYGMSTTGTRTGSTLSGIGNVSGGITPTGGFNYGSLANVFTQTPSDAAAPTPASLAALTGTTTTPVTYNTELGVSPARQSIFDVINDRLSQYGLGSLSAKVKQLIIDGATEDTITIQLQETPEYQRRFRANQERIKKGLSVLTPAEYLNVEDSYRQILRAYGLNQFDTDDYVSQFIANDISAAELSGRVSTAVQRVRNADPAISKTLKDYYGIGEMDMVAYVLDPNQQLPKIERQIAAAEIGTMARRQGIEPTVSVAEQLAAQGISAAEAQKGYATIADILPTAEKLSDIYQGVEDEYRLAQAEQEVFNTLASAQRKRQRLIGRETAAFSGESGLGRTSLAQNTGGQF
jgi:hypothetical protein